MKIAVDVASADNPLEHLVVGCVDAVNEHNDVEVIIIGDEVRITKTLGRHNFDGSRVSVVHTDEVINMDESPASAVKAKKNASVMIAARLVGKGEADGFFSPGNTGATLAASLLEIGRLKDVLRPAIATPMPHETGHFTILDAGANVDCTPEYLVQFAIMGEAYARHYYGIDNPKVALLSVGQERSKGNTLTKKTYERLEKIPFNFVGNIESDEMYKKNAADVVVADGFDGNVALKTAEGVAKLILKTIKRSVKKSIFSAIGAMLMKGAFEKVKDMLSSERYGSAPLLGVKGCVLIGHGNSSSLAVKNSILATARYIEVKVNDHISENLKLYGHAHPGLRIFEHD